MILVNGSEGIGTGWSTKIPCHNPREIIVNLRSMMNGEEPRPMNPWYKNFKGSTIPAGDGRFVSVGCCAILDSQKLEISELPVGTWTQNYKESVLEPLLHGGEKVKAVITDYKEYNTDTTVRFVISFLPGEFQKLMTENGGFHRVFKLTSSISITTMHSFDNNNCLRKYDNTGFIMKEFYALRLEYYEKRKTYMEGMLQAEADKLSNQARFIMEKCDRTLVVENKKRKVMIDELIKRGYEADPVKDWKRRIKADDAEDMDADEDEVEEIEEKPGKGTSSKKPADQEKNYKKLSDYKKFDYLLGMSMWMLTDERKNELLKQRDVKLDELRILKAKSPKKLWTEDLDVLTKKLDDVEAKERAEEEKMLASLTKSKASQGTKGRVIKTAAKKDITKPSPDGEPVDFKLSDEMLKKYEKAAAMSRGEKAVKKEKVVKSEAAEGEDEFDALVAGDGGERKPEKAKKPRVKKEPSEVKPKQERKSDGMKQTKLDFKKKSKKKADSDKSDIEIKSGSEDEFDALVKSDAPQREKNARRAASKVSPSFLLHT
jgi:DNA topoisomerase-2